ncbi:MAG TPA: S9 family peptidase [Vicinamibacterales bacterium]|nr:S9 family peptidase [Vicinamibacterales bacterium]
MRKRTSIVLVFLLLAAIPRAAEKRFITEKDLLKFTWIADPQIAPDGSAIAFVRVTVNEKENRYETSLFTVPTSGAEAPRQLTSHVRDTMPRWSPDGRRIAFARSVEKDGKPQPGQVYVLDLNGGEAYALTQDTKGVTSIEWSPDGKTVAFTAPVEGVEEDKPKDAKSDVQVITRAVYRSNGNPTYVDAGRHTHIFTVAATNGADKPQTKQITDGEYDEREIEWSPDGSKLYFVSTRVPEAYYEANDSDLYSVAATGGTITRVASIDGTINGPRVSPDGHRIAFVGTPHGNPVRSYSQSDLFVVDAAPGSAPRNLTDKYDFDIASGIGGDQAPPRGSSSSGLVWSKDGASLIVVSAEHGSANLKRLTIATGKLDPLTDGEHAVGAFTATPDGAKIAATISTQTNVGDLFMIDAKPRRITTVNEDLFKDIQQSEPEEIWYKSFDGKNVQGWILKPPDFDSSKKYPLILEIHGGPHAAYGNVYTHEFQWMAAKGYVVLFTNPRGSTSYGQEFGNIIQYHYPGDDFKDLMAGVDELLKRGYIDANRMGVTGGSGGGLLTNWTITQTQRFKAAVAQRDIADWYGFWFTADFWLSKPTWFRKAPWEDPQDFAARSPITHVANVTTPTMFVLGDQDYRTPPGEGGEMMFRALKYRKIPTVMVRFPRENHELSRSGEPKHRVERLQHIVGWMDQWLQGKKNPAYSTD